MDNIPILLNKGRDMHKTQPRLAPLARVCAWKFLTSLRGTFSAETYIIKLVTAVIYKGAR
jgi:hypothetical protein